MTVEAIDALQADSDLAPLSIAFPQTLTVGPVERRAHLPGAFVTDPTEAPSPLRITLRRRWDPWRAAAVFDQGKGYRWANQLNEPGGASLVLANDDPDLGAVGFNDTVLFEVDGLGVFTMLVREINSTTVSPNEEAGQLTTLSGPGSLAVLEEALVFPSRGPGVWPLEEDRVFSWPAPDYSDAWWGSPRAYASVYDDTIAWYGMRDGWPAGLPAQLVGPTVGSERFAPGGTWYLRTTFEADVSGMVTVYVVGDDYVTLYLDGQELITTEQWRNVPDDVKSEQVHVSAGTHTLAVEVQNSYGHIIHEGAPFNPSAAAVGVARFAADNTIDTVLAVSDDSWRCLEYPEAPPGMTPGEAMEHTLVEAQARGLLGEVAWTFNAQVDSAGVPWPVVGDIATKVGYDLLTFFRELTGTYVDLAISPGGYVLYAWASGQRGEVTDVVLHPPTDPTDPSSGNLGQLTHKRIVTPIMTLLVRWKGGWDVVGGGGREACLGLGADQSVAEIERVGQAQLDEINDEQTEIAAEIVPTGSNDRPVVDFDVGDQVTVPDYNGVPTLQRVISLAGSLDDNGRLSWAIELASRLLDVRERTEQAAKKMINGTLRGSSKVATPAGLVGKRNVPKPSKWDGG